MDIYTEQIIDLQKHPMNRGKMDGATASHSGVNVTCGDHVRIYVEIEEGRVKAASWEGDGCAISLAAASILTDEVKGRTLEEALSLKNEDIFAWLGVSSLGPARVKCATLSLETLQGALKKL
ncbi:MAG: iron-sulfur cluster assembly scaffold protein [Candidatus Wildermuthbacteria bacterium]|nr:iron-sulfur cluster assembly scaffold protein [Candidatus Wildermuthbacteria bacterium]